MNRYENVEADGAERRVITQSVMAAIIFACGVSALGQTIPPPTDWIAKKAEELWEAVNARNEK